MDTFHQSLQKKKELIDREENIYCPDDEEDEKEFKKEFPKTSTNFFNNLNKKKKNKLSRISPGRNSKDNLFNLTKRPTSKDSKIIEKFYMPFINKKTYNIKINNNLLRVKDDTRQNAFDSHHIIKKRNEIKNIGKELIIYQNPSKKKLFEIFNYFFL